MRWLAGDDLEPKQDKGWGLMSATDLRNPVRFRRKRLVVWALLLAVVAAGAFWTYRFFNPPWRVRVHIENIPTGTDFACLVSDSGGMARSMEWSPKSELSTPFTMHPARCVWSYQSPDHPKVNWNAHVRWEPGERYGVVTRNAADIWRVSWFEANTVPLRGRSWLFGGGEASFDVYEGQMVPLSAEQVKSLGLEKVADRK